MVYDSGGDVDSESNSNSDGVRGSGVGSDN